MPLSPAPNVFENHGKKPKVINFCDISIITESQVKIFQAKLSFRISLVLITPVIKSNATAIKLVSVASIPICGPTNQSKIATTKTTDIIFSAAVILPSSVNFLSAQA